MKPVKIRLKGRERLELFTNLHTMLTAGIPILETVESLEPDAKGGQQKILAELRRALNNGETLATAMKRFPRAFDDITINLLQAAESGGTLEETLDDIVKNTKKEIAFGSDIKAAMVYPTFVMVLFTGIVVMLLTFVIPRMSDVFTKMKIDVPPVTLAAMHASKFFLAHWPIVTLVAVSLLVLVGILYKTYKRATIRLLLSLPFLRRLGLNIDLMRLTRSLALLLKAGVPLDETLILAERTVQKKQVRAVIEKMQANTEAGKPLATGLRDSQLGVPVMMVHSMETAEESGTLEPTMQRLSEHFDTQATEGLKSISSLLEPIMIVVVGLLIGGLMLTVVIPMYSMTSQFRAGGL